MWRVWLGSGGSTTTRHDGRAPTGAFVWWSSAPPDPLTASKNANTPYGVFVRSRLPFPLSFNEHQMVTNPNGRVRHVSRFWCTLPSANRTRTDTPHGVCVRVHPFRRPPTPPANKGQVLVCCSVHSVVCGCIHYN